MTFIAREEKSMSGFTEQGLMQLVTLSWSQCSFINLKILGSSRIMLHPLCLCSISGIIKPGWQYTCLQHGLLNILSPLWRTAAQKKGFLSKHYCSLTMHLVTQELLWRRTKRVMLFTCLLTQRPFCSPQIKEQFQLSFKSYYLKDVIS